MTRFFTLIALLSAAFLVRPAWSAGEDLENCRYNNGVAMDLRVCESLRKAANRDAQTKRVDAQRVAKNNAEQEELRALKAAQTAASIQASQDRHQRMVADIAARDVERQRKDQERAVQAEEQRALRLENLAAQNKARQDERQREALRAKAAAENESRRKIECGPDYKTLQVGMAISRAQQCFGPFKLRGQLKRADGIVSTYVSGPAVAMVMDGKIVSWGR